MRFRIASAAFVAALAAPAFAADPPCPKCDAAACPTPGRMIVKVFTVADLVVPIPDFPPSSSVKPQPTPTVVRPTPVPPPIAVAGYRDVLVPRPTPAAPQAGYLRTAATTDEVPPGGVRVVCAESPTAVLLGGLKTCEAPAACPAPCADGLVKAITSTVRPATWQGAGGSGQIAFHPVGHCLVVHNTPEVVAEIETLLATMRKAQDQNVVVECRLVSVPAGFAERVGIDFAAGKTEAGPVAFLTDVQVFQMMEAVQGDRRATVLQTPKLTMFNGQSGCVECCDHKTFTTGLDVRTVNGQSVTVPKQETVALGTTLQVQPTMSADRKFVRLAFAVRQAELAEPVPLFPVTSMITPVFEGGSQGVPVPFTQFIQQPAVNVQSAQRTVVVPDGGSVMVPVGTRTVQTRTEFGPPVLSQVPYVNRLFKNVGIGRESQDVIAVLTARVVQAPAEEKACCASPAAGLVAEYRKACAAGKTEEAMKLAMKALAADPACFAGK